MLDFPACLASPAGATAVAMAWIAGAMVGSFLNVVAHRVPRGETVIFGRSHCPACGATIRSRDNVPVLGWLALGGRCRDCGTAISARYPLVEAACGGIAAALAAAELAAGAGDPATVAIAWAARSALALTLVAWALLADRGHAVPGRTIGAAAAAAAVAAATVPALAPLSATCADVGLPVPPGWPGCLLASVAGVAGGWIGGAACGGPTRAACCLVGAALGWQAAVIAAVAASFLRISRAAAAAGPWVAVVAVLAWHPLARAWQVACRCLAGG